MTYDYDLFVIGGGSGGVRASRVASQIGAKVGLAEEYRYGGTCVIRGCVPKKLMVYASQFSEHFDDASGFGWTVGGRSFDWGKFMAAKDLEINRLEEIYSKNLKLAGVTLYDARAIVTGPHEVTLGSTEVITAKTILIATGGWPFIPEFSGSELAISSNEIFELKNQPKRVLIVGGGILRQNLHAFLMGWEHRLRSSTALIKSFVALIMKFVTMLLMRCVLRVLICK